MNQILNHIFNIQTALAQPFIQPTSSATAGASAASETGNQATNLIQSFFGSIPYWVTGFIVIVLSLFLARIVKSTVENRMAEAGMEEEHKEIQLVAGRAASASVLLIGITAGLKIAGLDLTSIIAAAAFGVGFAMKDIIMNFISGIIILLQKQYSIGDWIKVKGTLGIIQEIQSRYTIIKKFDGTKVIVPNSELFKNQVTSLTGNSTRRFTIDITVDLYMDLKEVIDVIYASVDKVPKILKYPKPNIIVLQPGSGFNRLRVRCWVESRKGVLKPTSALVRQIHKDFYSRGWSWPYQTEKLIFDADVPPDVNERSKNYIEKHKSALKKEPGLLEQQQQLLAQQQKADREQTAQSSQEQPLPQAQQIGVGGPQNETPVWLQQAAGQNPAVQQEQQPSLQNAQPQVESMAAPQQMPGTPEQTAQPPVSIQNIEIGPEVKTIGPEPVQEPAAQQNQPMALPVIVAPDVQKPEQSVSAVQPPVIMAPDVQAPISGSQNQQN